MMYPLNKLALGIATLATAGTLAVSNVNLAPSIFDYPLLADKPIEQLEWVYRAEEVLRLEHNEMGRQYREGTITEAQWNEYLAKSFDEKSKWLGYEASVLRTKLGYTGFEMEATSTKQEAIRQENEKESFIKSSRWDIKTEEIFVANIAEAATEDFSTYTEDDPTSALTVTSAKVDIVSLNEGASTRVYKDKGSAYFNGDFEHLLEVYINSGTTAGINWTTWAVANITNLTSGNLGTAISGRAYFNGPSTNGLYITISSNQTGVTGLSQNTLYYVKYKRDEAVGTYGTAYVYVYSDSGRTSLVGSASVALVTAKYDYQYVYGMANYGNEVGAYVITGYEQNLDLQEGGGGAVESPSTSSAIIFEEI